MGGLLIALLVGGASAPVAAQCYQNGLPCGGLPRWFAESDVVLDASGNGTWTYDPSNPPPANPSVTHMPKAIDTTNPIICDYVARSITAVTIHCWRTNVSGLLAGLFGGTASGAVVTLQASAPRGQ